MVPVAAHEGDKVLNHGGDDPPRLLRRVAAQDGNERRNGLRRERWDGHSQRQIRQGPAHPVRLRAPHRAKPEQARRLAARNVSNTLAQSPGTSRLPYEDCRDGGVAGCTFPACLSSQHGSGIDDENRRRWGGGEAGRG